MKVTFFGHRNLTLSDKTKYELKKILVNLIEKGAKEFLLGGYGDFDNLSARMVYELKKSYPHIRTILVTPYINSRNNGGLYDEVEYPELENVPPKFAIIKRNEYMVD